MATNKTNKTTTIPSIYKVIIELSNGRSATLMTEDADMAQREYEVIRAAGRYSGFWVKSIRMEQAIAS